MREDAIFTTEFQVIVSINQVILDMVKEQPLKDGINPRVKVMVGAFQPDPGNDFSSPQNHRCRFVVRFVSSVRMKFNSLSFRLQPHHGSTCGLQYVITTTARSLTRSYLHLVREHFASPLLQLAEKDAGRTFVLVECPGINLRSISLV